MAYIFDKAGEPINPAIEEKQDNTITEITSVINKLSEILTESIATTAVEGLLDAATDGDKVGLITDLYRYLKIRGLNESLNSIDTNDVAPALTQYTKVTAIAQLAAAGSTVDVNVNQMSVYGYTCTVSAIDTTVVISITGTIDGTNYATLSLDSSAVPAGAMTTNQMTITANGTYHIFSSAPVDKARFTFVSETGGAAALLNVDFFGRRK